MTDLERLQEYLGELQPAEFLKFIAPLGEGYESYRILNDSAPARVDFGSSHAPVLFTEFRKKFCEQVDIWKRQEPRRFERALKAAGIPTDESARLSAEFRSADAAERAAQSADASNRIATDANRIASQANWIAIGSLLLSIVAGIIAIAAYRRDL